MDPASATIKSGLTEAKNSNPSIIFHLCYLKTRKFDSNQTQIVYWNNITSSLIICLDTLHTRNRSNLKTICIFTRPTIYCQKQYRPTLCIIVVLLQYWANTLNLTIGIAKVCLTFRVNQFFAAATSVDISIACSSFFLSKDSNVNALYSFGSGAFQRQNSNNTTTDV